MHANRWQERRRPPSSAGAASPSATRRRMRPRSRAETRPTMATAPRQPADAQRAAALAVDVHPCLPACCPRYRDPSRAQSPNGPSPRPDRPSPLPGHRRAQGRSAPRSTTSVVQSGEKGGGKGQAPQRRPAKPSSPSCAPGHPTAFRAKIIATANHARRRRQGEARRGRRNRPKGRA